MITPRFSVDQNETILIISIIAPLAKVSDAEVYIDGTEFKFYSKPYYLRLNFPKEIKDGTEKAKYDGDTGTFQVSVQKKLPEHFEGLDLLTKLLAPVGSQSAAAPLIEVVGESSYHDNSDSDKASDEADFDWQIEQIPFEESVIKDGPKYGFGMQRTGVLGRLQEELRDIVDLQSPDEVLVKDRTILRIENENNCFSDDHYMADLYEDESIQPLLQFKVPWQKHSTEPNTEKNLLGFTAEEKDKMLQLPRKEYLLDNTLKQTALLGLVDIMYAYSYNYRTTEGENNVESSWTIKKLSATLSWLEGHKTLKDTVVSGFRRSLTYPLYRHWKLSRKVFRDTYRIFKLGKRRLLKCLLDIHEIFLHGDSTYILNDLYITDYCVWIQSVKEKHVHLLAQELKKIVIEKCDIGFDLDELEEAAVMATEEKDSSCAEIEKEQAEPDGSVVGQLQNLHIEKKSPLITDVTNDLEALDLT